MELASVCLDYAASAGTRCGSPGLDSNLMTSCQNSMRWSSLPQHALSCWALAKSAALFGQASSSSRRMSSGKWTATGSDTASSIRLIGEALRPIMRPFPSLRCVICHRKGRTCLVPPAIAAALAADPEEVAHPDGWQRRGGVPWTHLRQPRAGSAVHGQREGTRLWTLVGPGAESGRQWNSSKHASKTLSRVGRRPVVLLGELRRASHTRRQVETKARPPPPPVGHPRARA